MSNSVSLFLSLCMLLPTAVAQQASSLPTLAVAPAELADAQRTAAALLQSPPTNGAAHAGAVLVAIRTGDASAAARLLAQGRERLSVAGATDAEGVAWLVCSHLWVLRAFGERERMAPRLPELLQAAERAAAQAPTRSFAQECMQVHMLFCVGNLLDHCERGHRRLASQPGARWAERAVERLLELERRSWQPGVGHYRPTLTSGEITVPAAADASLLIPAAAGMLIGSGDRILRHLHTTLAAAKITAADPHYLAAATLCRDAATRARSYTALRASDALQDPARAGFAFDAMCYAVSGLRLAVGAAVDEDWVRFSPWLPPGCSQLELLGLCSHGARFDLQLAGDGGPTLRLQLRLVSARDEASRTIVVHAGAEQRLQILTVGETLTTELARPQAEAQHELLPRGSGGH